MCKAYYAMISKKNTSHIIDAKLELVILELQKLLAKRKEIPSFIVEKFRLEVYIMNMVKIPFKKYSGVRVYYHSIYERYHYKGMLN